MEDMAVHREMESEVDNMFLNVFTEYSNDAYQHGKKEVIMLFFTYSFLAWLAETAVATVKVRNFRNRGFASGPFCFLYGFTGVILTVFLQELKNDVLFLFLGSMAVATAVEWFAGKTLERMKQKKWWDYSNKRWNFDGYICLQYSVLWGLLGFFAVQYGNGNRSVWYGDLRLSDTIRGRTERLQYTDGSRPWINILMM